MNCLPPLWNPKPLHPTCSFVISWRWHSRWGQRPFWWWLSFSGSLLYIHVIKTLFDFLQLICLMSILFLGQPEEPTREEENVFLPDSLFFCYLAFLSLVCMAPFTQLNSVRGKVFSSPILQSGNHKRTHLLFVQWGLNEANACIVLNTWPAHSQCLVTDNLLNNTNTTIDEKLINLGKKWNILFKPNGDFKHGHIIFWDRGRDVH